MAEISIALDVLGGDFAPDEIIKGAREALSEIKAKIILVGPQKVIEDRAADMIGDRVSIESAEDTIAMGEKAVSGLRARPENSISVSARLCKDGRAQAMVSAGNTGAVMTTALLTLGRIISVKRPALAVVIPTMDRPVVLIDVGANADCKPEYLEDFAILGSVFAEEVLGLTDPKVGLINIGEEPGKGNELYKRSYELLESAPINFFGNVEGKDIPKGSVDVYVCDGFTGNVILKLLEGVSSSFFIQIKSMMTSSISRKAAAAMLMPALMDLRAKLDQEEYGGAQLLGVKGVCIITHGSFKSRGIKNALKVAEKTVRQDLIGKINAKIEQKAGNIDE